jgi:hypothetical protein
MILRHTLTIQFSSNSNYKPSNHNNQDKKRRRRRKRKKGKKMGGGEREKKGKKKEKKRKEKRGVLTSWCQSSHHDTSIFNSTLSKHQKIYR